ncbi:transglutaminase domain-containing protein [bacterium]|nr:transglutaminase domain-containing protein [candidate division CSSED10-310 bacterium]
MPRDVFKELLPFWVFLLLFQLVASSTLAASNCDVFVNGTWSVKYLIQDPQKLIIPSTIKTSYYSQSFKKLHRGYEIYVECDLSEKCIPLPFTVENVAGNEYFTNSDLMGRLKNVRHLTDAVREVIGWVDTNISYQSQPNPKHTPKDILQDKSGNCVDRAELIKKILSEIGVSSRTVSGVLFHPDNSCFHRWIEVDYGKYGTFASEPGVTQDYIDPYHLILTLSSHAPDNITYLEDIDIDIEIIDEQIDWYIIDRSKPLDSSYKRLFRRNTTCDRNYAAIVGKVDTKSFPHVTAELRLSDSTLTCPLDECNRFSFCGLTEGGYYLTLKSEQQVVLCQKIKLIQKELKIMNLEIPHRLQK